LFSTLVQVFFKKKKTNCNSNQQNHEGSRSKVHSQQIDFTETTHISNKSLSYFSSWIIDSGATDHICSSLTHFTSYHQINPISVKLPNGNQVIANYSESVFLNQNHVINNVIYIPNLTFNLFQ